jgi:hypothetical protein
MKGGALNNDVRAQEYYRIAYKCIELSQTKKGCDHQCAKCTLNIHLYVDNVRDATLIKTSAGIDYQRQIAVQKMWNSKQTAAIVGPLISLLFVAAIIILPVRCIIHKIRPPTAATQEYVPNKATPEVTHRILAACNVSAKTADINKDSLVNCIDHALAFYEYYGTDAHLIWMVFNDRSSHLFCAVPNGYGSLIYIEPSKTGTVLINVLMQTVWYSSFKLVDCRDVTYAYLDIKNNRYEWRWR